MKRYKETWVTPEGYKIVVSFNNEKLIDSLSSNDLPFGYEIPHVDTALDLFDLKWTFQYDTKDYINE